MTINHNTQLRNKIKRLEKEINELNKKLTKYETISHHLTENENGIYERLYWDKSPIGLMMENICDLFNDRISFTESKIKFIKTYLDHTSSTNNKMIDVQSLISTIQEKINDKYKTYYKRSNVIYLKSLYLKPKFSNKLDTLLTPEMSAFVDEFIVKHNISPDTHLNKVITISDIITSKQYTIISDDETILNSSINTNGLEEIYRTDEFIEYIIKCRDIFGFISNNLSLDDSYHLMVAMCLYGYMLNLDISDKYIKFKLY